MDASRYFTTLYIIIMCLTIFTSFGDRCGPLDQCTCTNRRLRHQDHTLSINCRKTNTHLHNVCEYIIESNISSKIILDVSQNNITILNKTNLKGCKNVVSLDLAENRIQSMVSNTFADMVRLVEMDLSNNRLVGIYKRVSMSFLTKLPRLKRLRLNGNLNEYQSTEHYSYPDIQTLTSLVSLTLDGLFSTPFGPSYRSLVSLENINLNGSLGHCNIGRLTEETFRYVPNVKSLDLSKCNLTQIDAETFSVLPKLRWLDLSLNRKLGLRVARNVSYGLQFTQIDFVNFSYTEKTFGLGTKLLKRDICYIRNSTLREVALSGNRLEMFEDNLLLLLPPSLQVMHLEDNRFTFGLYLMQLGCLTNFTTFKADRQNIMHDPRTYLKQNFSDTVLPTPIQNDCPFMTEKYLMNLSASISDCPYIGMDPVDFTKVSLPPNLSNASLTDSNLQYSVGKIPILPFINRIENIDVSGNVLHALIGPLGPLLSLKTLNISRNYCTFIGQDFFTLMNSLEKLDARHNFIGSVLANDTHGEILKPLKKLEHLILSTNQIKVLPPNVLQYLVNLRFIDLSHNTIDMFSISISQLKHLAILDLSNNAIQTLPDHIVDHFKTRFHQRNVSYSINLYKNPIQCSCNNKKFLQWMLENRKNFEHFDNYTFLNEDGKLLALVEFISRVEHFDKECSSYTVTIIICTLLISFFLSTIIGGIIYKNRWKLRYVMYMNNRRFYGYLRPSDEAPIANFRYDAFISYADEDINFIIKEIIPNLETDNLKLCIHQRDFLPGNTIADNIIDAIQSSKRTVVILSNKYLKRKWCIYEFNMARMESIYSRNGGKCLLMVILENVSTRDMSLEMIQWIKEESYIEFTRDEDGYQLFWNNLKDAIISDINHS